MSDNAVVCSQGVAGYFYFNMLAASVHATSPARLTTCTLRSGLLNAQHDHDCDTY